VPTDVTDTKAVSALAKAAIIEFGSIDVWVNNVGIGVVGAFDTVPFSAHRRVIEANLIGHMNGAHAALPHFKGAGRGTLINMISIGGWASTPYSAAYTASKFGLRGFSEALRAEVSGQPGIHVCEVYPTFVDSPGISHGANYTGKHIEPPSPMLDPREVADTVVALAFARHPRASTMLGSVALPARLSHALAPDLTGRITRRLMDHALGRADPAPVTDGNLFEPSRGHEIDGGYRQAHSRALPAAAAVVGVAALACWLAARARR
ncbi:MAG: SDR family oxidoreductase, partial [Haliea sp.]